MRIFTTIELAYRGLGTKPARTFLTLLGIAIGIASVIAIASLGAGTQQLITDEISGLGADVISIQPGRNTSGLADIASRFSTKSLDTEDVEALRRKENVPHALAVLPLVLIPGAVTFETETFYPQIVGGSAEFYESLFDIRVREGSMFGESEIREKASIAVIGHTVNEELFKGRSGYGERITIQGKKFRVTGVMPPMGQVAFAQIDDMVLIPYTTAQTYLLGQKHFNQIIVQVDDPVYVSRTERDIQATLRESHRLTDGQEDDFAVQTPSALIEQVGTILGTLTLFLTAVVAIALVVGGIGIMNIMLVSVTERTREIGLRKAVGATDGDILTQFLFEAIMLTMLGGVVGIMTGAGIAYGASVAIRTFSSLDWTFVFPVEGAVLALLFSAGIGLAFGLYPARKASRKSPMEALRYE